MRTTFICTSVCCVLLAACASPSGPGVQSHVGLGCIDDSSQCISSRQNALRVLLDDPKRGWVYARPTPGSYATGVRLFAYKQKKRELTCKELKHGTVEAANARPSLGTARQQLTDAQMARATMLADEVGRELKREMRRRCKRA